jgi:hypothetical protein
LQLARRGRDVPLAEPVRREQIYRLPNAKSRLARVLVIGAAKQWCDIR